MSATELTALRDDPAKLPAVLAPLTARAQWCVWRGARGDDGRWRPAVYIQATDPATAVVVDVPATWCDYATAATAVQRGEADGIAFVLTESDSFAVIELGHCRHPRNGSIDIWAQNFLDVTRHSYVEATPGGDGCVIWGLSDASSDPLDWGFAFEIDDKPITVGLLRRSPRIVAVTGLWLNAVGELADIDREIDWALVWGDRREAAIQREEEAALGDNEETAPELAPQQDEEVALETSTWEDVIPPFDAEEDEPTDKPAEALPPPPPPEITLTRLTKKGGPFTKKIALAANGKSTVNDHSACSLSVGTAERIKVAGVAGLGKVIEGLTPSQGLALGSLRAGLADKVHVVTKKALGKSAPRPDVIARTNAHIVYDGPAFTLLDYDTKGMPLAVRRELERLGGFWPALLTVLPALRSAARLTRSSTSSGLSRSDTGAPIPGSDGIHIYVESKEGVDVERFLKTLHERCWLAGLGWMMVGTSGALLERSIVDRMVGQPGRPVFEGGPVLDPPLAQDKEKRRPVAVEGAVLDTAAACRPLSIVERARLKDLKGLEMARLAPEEAKERERFITEKAGDLSARTGMSAAAARAVIIRQREGVLLPDIVLPFDDEALEGCTVGDVLADPDRFEGETMADPLEGVEYGRCCAKIMRRSDGTPWIHSFAHGRTIYELKYDAAHVYKAIEAAAKDEVVAVYADASVAADLSAVESATLRQQVKKISGINMPAIDATLQAAQQQHAAAKAKSLQAWRASRRRDPRPQIPRPFPDEPWLPQMAALNEVIGVAEAPQPPGRDIDGDAMKVRKFGVPGTHAFMDANDETNPEGDEE